MEQVQVMLLALTAKLGAIVAAGEPIVTFSGPRREPHQSLMRLGKIGRQRRSAAKATWRLYSAWSLVRRFSS